jgi:beta-xylosidase
MFDLTQWNIINNNNELWSIKEDVLRVQIAEGNMWGLGSDTKDNLFLHPISASEYSVQVKVEFTPLRTFEQAGIGVFWDKDNYIKISKEMFNGELSLVFATEENSLPRVNQLIRYSDTAVAFKLDVTATHVIASYKALNEESWIVVGSTPRLAGNEQGIMLYTFSGNKLQPNTAAFYDFELTRS